MREARTVWKPLQISRRTVIRIKQRFVQEDLEVALTGTLRYSTDSIVTDS
jgi:hypothetical protein